MSKSKTKLMLGIASMCATMCSSGFSYDDIQDCSKNDKFIPKGKRTKPQKRKFKRR